MTGTNLGITMRANRCFLPVLVLFIIVLASWFPRDAAAEVKSGEQIYSAAAGAVFVVEVHDANGNLIASGTAFVVTPQHLITNAHVVHRGKPYLRVGPALITCTIERTDDRNDLALLSVETLISVAPLPLAATEPKPGATVFTLGNPSGLENSISDGLFTGIRNTGTRKLMQISAPVSPGSGSPLFDVEGGVIGVVASSLTEGQNLNFAVPASAVRSLLDQTTTDVPAPNVDATLAEIADLQGQLYEQEFSVDPTSAYQQLSGRTTAAWEKALASAGSDVKLLRTVCLSASDSSNSDVAARAGLKLLDLSRNIDPTERSATARALYYQALFAANDAEETTAKQALNVALPLVKVPTTSSSRDLITVADIYSLLKRHSDAEACLKYALSRSEASSDENTPEILWDLVLATFALNKPNDARRFFSILESGYSVSAFQYKSYADSVANLNSPAEAALAYHHAALNYAPTATKARFEAICEASRHYWMAGQLDDLLSTGRACLNLGSSLTNVDDSIEVTHRLLADALNQRGVYDEALAHAKNALAIQSDDGWASYQAGFALRKLGRLQEALVVAKAAVRSTDGKYSTFHFLVGNIYFDLENWEQAILAFEKAAQMDVVDTAAAYNIALCYLRKSYYRDAARWLEEVLRRNPNHPERVDLLRQISQLRQ